MLMFCSNVLCKSTKTVDVFQGGDTVLIKLHEEGELGERKKLEAFKSGCIPEEIDVAI